MRITPLLLGIMVLLFAAPAFAFDFVEFGAPPERGDSGQINKIKLVDARGRDAWMKETLPGSVTLEWDHFSQPGAPSRGIPRKNSQIVADDLAEVGIHLTDIVYVFGDGPHGRGNEGRIAWMLYGLGFRKVYVSSFTLAVAWWKGPITKGASIGNPAKKWIPRTRTDLVLEFSEFQKWREKKKKYLLIAIRPLRDKYELPGVYRESELRFAMRNFDLHGEEVKKALDSWMATKGYPKNTPILPISFAGLSSAYAALRLKSWGYEVRLIPEGYSSQLR